MNIIPYKYNLFSTYAQLPNSYVGGRPTPYTICLRERACTIQIVVHHSRKHTRATYVVDRRAVARSTGVVCVCVGECGVMGKVFRTWRRTWWTPRCWFVWYLC